MHNFVAYSITKVVMLLTHENELAMSSVSCLLEEVLVLLVDLWVHELGVASVFTPEEMDAYVCVCMYVCMHVRTYVCMCMYVCIILGLSVDGTRESLKCHFMRTDSKDRLCLGGQLPHAKSRSHTPE